MKKILALVLALIMVLSLVACGGKTAEPAPAAKEEAAAAAGITLAPKAKINGVHVLNKIYNTSLSGDALVIDDRINKIDYKLAKCCNPIMGDDIFGFVTINSGITIHRHDCPNAARLRENYPYRIMEARWREQVQGGAFRASIKIVADDTTGMVNRITEVVNRDLKLNIRSMNLSSGGGTLSGMINVEVPSTNVVDMLIHSILRIRGVQRAYRVNN